MPGERFAHTEETSPWPLLLGVNKDRHQRYRLKVLGRRIANGGTAARVS